MVATKSLLEQSGLTFREAIKLIMESPCKPKTISELYRESFRENYESPRLGKTVDPSPDTQKG